MFEVEEIDLCAAGISRPTETPVMILSFTLFGVFYLMSRSFKKNIFYISGNIFNETFTLSPKEKQGVCAVHDLISSVLDQDRQYISPLCVV